MGVYVFGIAALGFAYWYVNRYEGPDEPAPTPREVVLERVSREMFPSFRERASSRVKALGASEQRQLERQRETVAALARRNVGLAPAGGELSDLQILQQLLDRDVLDRDQAFELQALGVVLGDVMAKQLGLRWVVVDDEKGRSRALQYGDGDDVFFPVTMISRRHAVGLPVDVEGLYRETKGEVAKLRARPGRR